MSNTVKIVVRMHTGYCGMDATEFYELHKPYIEEALIDFCWERACNNAESYGIYPSFDRPDDEDDDQYSENIEGWYELYDPDEHDGLRIIGTSPHFEELSL